MCACMHACMNVSINAIVLTIRLPSKNLGVFSKWIDILLYMCCELGFLRIMHKHICLFNTGHLFPKLVELRLDLFPVVLGSGVIYQLPPGWEEVPMTNGGKSMLSLPRVSLSPWPPVTCVGWVCVCTFRWHSESNQHVFNSQSEIPTVSEWPQGRTLTSRYPQSWFPFMPWQS